MTVGAHVHGRPRLRRRAVIARRRVLDDETPGVLDPRDRRRRRSSPTAAPADTLPGAAHEGPTRTVTVDADWSDGVPLTALTFTRRTGGSDQVVDAHGGRLPRRCLAGATGTKVFAVPAAPALARCAARSPSRAARRAPTARCATAIKLPGETDGAAVRDRPAAARGAARSTCSTSYDDSSQADGVGIAHRDEPRAGSAWRRALDFGTGNARLRRADHRAARDQLRQIAVHRRPAHRTDHQHRLGRTLSTIEVAEHPARLGQRHAHRPEHAERCSRGRPPPARIRRRRATAAITVVHGGGNSLLPAGAIGGDTIVVTGGGGPSRRSWSTATRRRTAVWYAANPSRHVDGGDFGPSRSTRPEIGGRATTRFLFPLGNPFHYAGNDVIDARAVRRADRARSDGRHHRLRRRRRRPIIGSQTGDHLAGGSGERHDPRPARASTTIYGDSGVNVDVITRALTIPTANAQHHANADGLARGRRHALGRGRGQSAPAAPASATT